jgi:hypothetical protein
MRLLSRACDERDALVGAEHSSFDEMSVELTVSVLPHYGVTLGLIHKGLMPLMQKGRSVPFSLPHSESNHFHQGVFFAFAVCWGGCTTMTSPLQRRLFESRLTSSPSWIELINQLPIDLSEYTSFLTNYSDTVLSPSEDQLQIENLLEDDLFEDFPREPIVSEKSMSNNQQSSYLSQSYVSSSFTSSRNGDAPQVWRSTESTSSNPEGTTIHRTSEQPGQLATQETLSLDQSGRMIGQQPATTGRIKDVSDEDKKYEERIEDEYAKREGGA